MTIDIQRRHWLAATAAGASLAALEPLARGADAATLPNIVPPAQLRIGFQKSAVNLVIVKESRALEQRFPDTRVHWLEFPAGPQQLEALSAGSLDVAITGDTPPVFAQAAGRDLRYIGVEPPKPDSSAILVPRGSALQALADLKGKRVALQKGSSAHFLIVSGLRKGGLTFADIQPVYLTPADARAAFERGSVDAWGIWDPYYAATELAIGPRVLATGRGLSSNNTFYFAPRALPSSTATPSPRCSPSSRAPTAWCSRTARRPPSASPSSPGCRWRRCTCSCRAGRRRRWGRSRPRRLPSSSAWPMPSMAWG